MTAWHNIASVAVTAALVGGAVVMGGGAPVSPSDIADASSFAAGNAAEAARTMEQAAGDAEAMATIARNVGSQLASSRRLLDIQLRIEASSRGSVLASRELSERVEDIRDALDRLTERVRRLARSSGPAVGASERAASAVRSLQEMLDRLERRFDVTVEESRELNRKARGYAKLREGLP